MNLFQSLSKLAVTVVRLFTLGVLSRGRFVLSLSLFEIAANFSSNTPLRGALLRAANAEKEKRLFSQLFLLLIKNPRLSRGR